MNLVVQVHDVHKTYGSGGAATPVLKGVSLEVTQGECVFLAGPSGSGKSTLLSILGGILTPDRGKVALMDQDIYKLRQRKRAQLRRDGIGFVFQRFQLVRGLNSLDNVSVPLVLQGYSQSAARKTAKELLEAVGLADQIMSRPHQMSGGQCQRVALARALAGDPELILADEPTAALDAENGRQVMELLRKLIRDHHKTAVVVTHDHRVFHYADRILHMENGLINKHEAADRKLSAV